MASIDATILWEPNNSAAFLSKPGLVTRLEFNTTFSYPIASNSRICSTELIPPPHANGINASLAMSLSNSKSGSSPLIVAPISSTANSSIPFLLNILTALTGSPKYVLSLNFIVLNKSRSSTNKTGIILGLVNIHFPLRFSGRFRQNFSTMPFRNHGSSPGEIELL